jgi:hypothetical protein
MCISRTPQAEACDYHTKPAEAGYHPDSACFSRLGVAVRGFIPARLPVCKITHHTQAKRIAGSGSIGKVHAFK